MTWDEAMLQAIEEVSEESDAIGLVCLKLMLRAGQLTTETEGCSHCKPSKGST